MVTNRGLAYTRLLTQFHSSILDSLQYSLLMNHILARKEVWFEGDVNRDTERLLTCPNHIASALNLGTEYSSAWFQNVLLSAHLCPLPYCQGLHSS